MFSSQLHNNKKLLVTLCFFQLKSKVTRHHKPTNQAVHEQLLYFARRDCRFPQCSLVERNGFISLSVWQQVKGALKSISIYFRKLKSVLQLSVITAIRGLSFCAGRCSCLLRGQGAIPNWEKTVYPVKWVLLKRNILHGFNTIATNFSSF